MSIIDNEGKTLIRLSTIWSWAFKLCLLLTPVGFSVVCTWGVWVTVQIFDHSATLRLLEHKTGLVTSPAMDPANTHPPRLVMRAADSHGTNDTCP